MENKIDASEFNESQIYQGGTLSPINAADLMDNEVGIKQLINTHLLTLAQSQQKDLEIQNYKSTIEYLKTSPFIGIVAGIINVSGSLLLGFAVNLYTQEAPQNYSWVILLLGFLLILTGSLCNILYPYARKWFNRKSN